MIEATTLLDGLRAAGFGLVAGVPCSYLTPLISAAIDDPGTRYVNAANEGEAVAIACGAELGGVPSVVMFQNSGFGNAVSPLTSLAAVFDLPVLVVTSWRGEPGGPADEPQHELMGPITPGLFDLMGIPWERFPDVPEGLAPLLDRAVASMRSSGRPYGLILPKGAISGPGLRSGPDLAGRTELTEVPAPSGDHDRLDPDEVLTAVQRAVEPTDVVLATTGHSGRALYALDDRPNQLYMVGSMGCVSSLGLGLALARPERRVVVVDGDGAFLMRMGAAAAVAAEAPPNLVHLVLDNSMHESTGGQATLAAGVDVASVAAASGYPDVRRLTSVDEVAEFVATPPATLSFAHVRTTARHGADLPRPTVSPREVAARLRTTLGVRPSEDTP